MRKLIASLRCALISAGAIFISALLPAQADPFAYISSQETDSITVIDTATDTVVDVINFESLGFAVAVDPSGSTFYIASGGSACATCISVVDTTTNAVVNTIELDHNPITLVVSPDGSKLYASRNESNTNSATVTVINTVTLTIDTVIELPRSALDNRVNPRTMTLTPDGMTLYVNDFTGQRVILIDTASHTISGEILVNTCPLGMDITRDGSRVYVASFCAHAVNVIDTSSNTVVDTIFNTGARTAYLAVSPDGSTVYVTNIITDHTVTVIDTATNSIVDTIAVGTEPIEVAVTPDGAKVYVPNKESNSVSVIDTASNTVVTTIPNIVAPNFLGNFIAQGVPPHSLNITAGPSGIPDPVASGGGVELDVTAVDSEGHELTYAWMADCSSWTDDNGTFNDAGLRQPIWTAPVNETGDPRECLISVRVEDGKGLFDQGSYSQRVTEVPHNLSITEGPSGTPNPVATRGTVNLHVAATDNRGHALNYLWTSNCPESSFNDNTLQQPVWTAPPNNTGSTLECVISVTVDDGTNGFSDEGFFAQRVSSGPTGQGVLDVKPTTGAVIPPFITELFSRGLSRQH
ncbi:hypothetical protein QP938_06305 [Porticoccaceae bacterium LTM1]|nr:hypothetical protein QP938_06305 [Porticoccaceae bacterium LTM1]